MRKKILIFHKALAPYRIDLFNGLNEAFDANVYLFRRKMLSQKFDMAKLESQLTFKPRFIINGVDFRKKGRMIRFGYLNKIAHHKPDIILCWEYNIITFLTAAFTKIFFPKTQVYTICDDSVDVAKQSSGVRRIGRYLCLKLLAGIILGNDSAEEWYNKNFPGIKTTVFPIIQKEERIMSIMNTAQQISREYHQQLNLDNKKVLLFVGRLVQVKNLNFLIDTFVDYANQNKDAVLILVGDGDKKSELVELVERLGMQKNIIFAGRYENEALYAWYRIADFFILPSISETFGAVVNESLIAGVPVFCSNLAGAACLINENNGATFNPYDKAELLTILNTFLKEKRKSDETISMHNSLMPYTFNQRMNGLISFLGHENSRE